MRVPIQPSWSSTHKSSGISSILASASVESVELEANVESKSDSSVDVDGKTEDIPEDSE